MGFYHGVRIPNHIVNATAFAKNCFETRNVLIMPGSGFGSLGQRHIRLSFTNSINMLKLGFRHVGSALQLTLSLNY